MIFFVHRVEPREELVSKLGQQDKIQSVALGTRHIIDVMNDNGYNISVIRMNEGGTKNPIWLWEHADITGCQV